jgi:hypothetical protein
VQSSGPCIAVKPSLPPSPLAECGRGLFIVNALGTGYATGELPLFGNQTVVEFPLHGRRGVRAATS